MKEENKNKDKEFKVNWIGLINILLCSFVFALIGMGLAPTILRINNYAVSYNYAQWGSYMVVILLSIMITKNINLTKEVKK